MWEIKTRTQNPKPDPYTKQVKKQKVRKMKLEMGALEEPNYVCARLLSNPQ